MITPKTSIIALGLTLAPLVACSGDTPKDRGRFEIAALALSLNPITGASYDITVRNANLAPDNIVWTKSEITSAQYGDGRGAITYIGACDVTSNPHTIELVLRSISDTSEDPVATDAWVNPAPPGSPIVLAANCQENRDTPVVFNLTIMRDAQQGFFDIAVNFEDIFCSAKVDCKDALLHDGDDRGPTAVFGFACTAGSGDDGAEPTWLHMTDIVIECDGMPPLYFDPAASAGSHGPLGVGPVIFETAIYRGQEQLPGLDKCYWNAAFGISVGHAPNCRLRAQATASHAPFGPTGTSPSNTVYPYVDFDVMLSDAGGNLICDNSGLDDDLSGVTTAYTTPTGAGFTHEWECNSGTDPVANQLACNGTFVDDIAVGVLPSPGGLRVSFGGVRSDEYTLPSGAFVAADASCCVNPCCDSSN